MRDHRWRSSLAAIVSLKRASIEMVGEREQSLTVYANWAGGAV